MIDQLKRAGIVLLLAVMSDYASGSDYTVTRGTEITSERPIGLLIAEAGLGVLNGPERRILPSEMAARARRAEIETALRIDGRPAPGIRGMARAAWRLVGFLVWDASGRIERVTTATVRGHAVQITDTVENGNVVLRVVVGPPLGDKRVRYAVLELEANENDLPRMGTRIRLGCAAVIDLPGDRCRLVRRLAERVADNEAGKELRSRVDDLETAGRLAVDVGRGQIRAVIAEFLERVCR